MHDPWWIKDNGFSRMHAFILNNNVVWMKAVFSDFYALRNILYDFLEFRGHLHDLFVANSWKTPNSIEVSRNGFC